jgi:uncharacterized membrane protein
MVEDKKQHDSEGFVLHQIFGGDFFGKAAELFARFFGTPAFIILQTLFVFIWICINVFTKGYQYDPYPFILLNLVFSTQAAYAAPLILLAQTRQVDRDKIWERSDASHREELHNMVIAQQLHTADAAKQTLEVITKMEDILFKIKQCLEDKK